MRVHLCDDVNKNKGLYLPPSSFSFYHLASEHFACLLSLSLFPRVEDKQKVADLVTIPKFLPEVTIGAHEYDTTYYAYKSVWRKMEFQ